MDEITFVQTFSIFYKFASTNTDRTNAIAQETNGMVTGRFAPKPVPPGTIRPKTIFRTGRFTPGRFAPFGKNEIKVF